jgi:hypothetical protein
MQSNSSANPWVRSIEVAQGRGAPEIWDRHTRNSARPLRIVSTYLEEFRILAEINADRV